MLGAPEIWHNDSLVERFVSKKARGLLYYLVAERGKKNRNELAALLWDDFNLPTAQNNLRTTLHHLKKDFAECLAIEPRQVCFCPPASTSIDIDLIRTIHPGSTPEDLISAITVYRDDFLAGFNLEDTPRFEAWRLKTRTYYHRLAIGHMLQLAGHYERQNRLEDGLAIAQRILELQPFNESAILYRMQFFNRLGWREHAIQEYLDYDALLKNQFQGIPASSLTAFYNSIHDTHPITVKTNLPRRLTSFFGRSRVLELLSNWLRDYGHPLVNLWGMGGMGKTRLAIEAGESLKAAFRDGVYYARLKDTPADAENEEHDISGAICQAFQVQVDSLKNPKEQMIAAIGGYRALLILDNYWPTPAADGLIFELVEAAAEVQLLVISQPRLQLPCTTAIHLHGLDYPLQAQLPVEFDPQYLSTFASLQLFEERTQRVSPAFGLDERNWRQAARICEILQGMPLAIEVAANLTRYLPIEAILRIVEEDPGQVLRISEDEQQAYRLRQILESAYNQTHPRHQEIAGVCTLFEGGFTLEAFEAVSGTSATMLYTLIDKSLVESIAPGRYVMHPMVKSFLKEKTRASTYRYLTAYSSYYLGWLIQQDNTIQERSLSVVNIYSELSNVESAWQNALALGEFELIRDASSSLVTVYKNLGLIEPAYAMLRKAAQYIEALPEKNTAQLTALGTVLLGLSYLEELKGNLVQASNIPDQVLALAETLNDNALRAGALMRKAAILYLSGDSQNLITIAKRGLEAARYTKNRRLMAYGFVGQGMAYMADQQYEQAETIFETGLKQGCVDENSLMMEMVLINLGICYLSQGKLEQALSYCHRALKISQKLSDLPSVTMIRFRIAQIHKCAGQLETTRQMLDGVLEDLEKLKMEGWQILTLSMLAYLQLWSGEADPAYQLALKAEGMARRLAFPNLPAILILKGRALLALGQYAEAGKTLNEAEILLRSSPRRKHDVPYLVAAQIDLALAQGLKKQAGALANSILPDLGKLNYDSNDDPFTVYLSLYKALNAIGDPGASEVLNDARKELARLGDNKPAAFNSQDLLKIPCRATLNEMIHNASEDFDRQVLSGHHFERQT